jgi:hypothetical protein
MNLYSFLIDVIRIGIRDSPIQQPRTHCKVGCIFNGVGRAAASRGGAGSFEDKERFWQLQQQIDDFAVASVFSRTSLPEHYSYRV